MKPSSSTAAAWVDRHRARLQRGQAMVEYVVVCAALVFALFVPIKDANSPDKARTTVEILIDAMKLAYQRISFALSIPT